MSALNRTPAPPTTAMAMLITKMNTGASQVRPEAGVGVGVRHELGGGAGDAPAAWDAHHNPDVSHRLIAPHDPANVLHDRIASRFLAPAHFWLRVSQAPRNKQFFELRIALNKSPHLIVGERAGLQAHHAGFRREILLVFREV